MNYIYGMTTLKALIELEIRALANITQVKATIYKTWKPLAEKWRLWVTDDTCTEYDATFVFDLPTLPEKVQSDFRFVEVVLDDGKTIFYLGFCHAMTSDSFVSLVKEIVQQREFNFSHNGFDYPLVLPNDINRVKYWFEKYKTNNWTLSFDDWFFGDCLKDQVICDDATIDLSYCEYLIDENFGADVTGYQVAQQLTLFFYGFLQSVLLPYCLDLLDRFIQIVHDTRSVIFDKYCDDAFVYLDIGETA